MNFHNAARPCCGEDVIDGLRDTTCQDGDQFAAGTPRGFWRGQVLARWFVGEADALHQCRVLTLEEHPFFRLREPGGWHRCPDGIWAMKPFFRRSKEARSFLLIFTWPLSPSCAGGSPCMGRKSSACLRSLGGSTCRWRKLSAWARVHLRYRSRAHVDNVNATAPHREEQELPARHVQQLPAA